ncbi:uncharacterized protein LOC126354210 isoform X3 [Schistocerca gregaria]|uniref:uncharacterized protein LOC126354210 isoform X3 n=1 Tax=Schistocerca gregaria TaxID=7010 RepID=UPI00211DB8B9|nr:uncharacterized protein LOC126354210 isoform X3 [Schistocerca gregaria]
MAAEQVKLKCAFRSGSLLVVVLLHAVAYSTATGAFVRYLPDPAANVVPNVPPETYFHYVAESDSSTQSTVIRIKQEPYVVVKVSNLEFCTVIWSNKHLLRRVPARRAIKDFCRSIRQSGKEMVTATEVTSVLDVTATGESGKALRAEAGLADRQDPSAEALNLKKLSKWCKYRKQIDNKLVRIYLPDICSNLDKTDTDMSAESNGTVTFAQVTKDADPITEAVTLKTAYTYSAQSAVTSLKPEMGAAYNISDTELGVLVCQNFHLINISVSFIARRTLGLYCKVMNLTDTGTSTAAATEVMSARKLTATAAAGTSEGPSGTSRVPDTEQAATSLTQQKEPSSHISSSTKLKEVCRHLNQVKNKMFGPFLPALCKHVDEPDTDMSAESNRTVTTAQVTKDADPITEAVTLKTAYTYSAQSAVTSLKPETGAAYNISNTELGVLVCQNFRLIDNSLSFIARRALLLYCKNMKLTDTGTSTAAATDVMSTRKLTTTAAAGTSEGPSDTSRVPDAEQAATSLTQQEEPSSHISSLTKLREVCRHLNQVKNKMFGPFLPALCKHVDEPDKSAELNGTVIAAKVNKDVDPMTEAVTLKTAYTYSAQSAVTSLKPEMGAAYNVSDTELGQLVCQNFILIDNSLSFIARRALLLYCKNMKLTDTGTSTAAATEVMSTRKLTTTAAAGTSEGPSDTSRVPDAEQAATSLTQQEEPSSHISSLTKLREVCRHLNQVKNKMFGPFLPALCKHVDEPDKSAELNGTVTAAKVNKDVDTMTEAVTLKTAYTYSAQSAVTSLKPEMGAAYNVSDTELGQLVCQNFILIDNSLSFIARRALLLYCKNMKLTGTATITAGATEVISARKLTTTAAAGTSEGPFDTSRVPDTEPAATSLTQQEEPSSHISSLTKLREVCRHLNQVKNKMFGPFLPALCKHVDEPDSTAQPYKQMTSSPSGEPIKGSNDETVDEAVDESTNEAARPTTLMTNTRRHESVDESINKSYEECGFESYDDIDTY